MFEIKQSFLSEDLAIFPMAANQTVRDALAAP